jgi:hypothetical protein
MVATALSTSRVRLEGGKGRYRFPTRRRDTLVALVRQSVHWGVRHSRTSGLASGRHARRLGEEYATYFRPSSGQEFRQKDKKSSTILSEK